MQCLEAYVVVMPCCRDPIALMSVTTGLQLWWCLFACDPVSTQLRGRHTPCFSFFPEPFVRLTSALLPKTQWMLRS